jgi:hypothetical protein
LILHLRKALAEIDEPEWKTSRLVTELGKRAFFKQIPRRTLRDHVEREQRWIVGTAGGRLYRQTFANKGE